MQRNLKALSDGRFDLLIIGGGINGVAAAWDASLRGLQTALIDKSDFGSETSAASLKIVHGGLRYLQHLDFVRMRESIRERSTMLRIAPHLVEPLPFLVATSGHFMKGPEAMAAAVIMNEIISCDRNRYITDPARRLPAGRVFLSPRRCRELVPGLEQHGLNGGVIFYDAQMYSAERLTLAFALSAAEQGALLANYVEATGLIREGSRVVGARVRDRLQGDEFEIRADVVANMTGPWSDIVVSLLSDDDPDRTVLRSKGIQMVGPPLTRGVAVAVPGRQKDPEAVLSRGARHYFITPWRGVSLIGTTDTVYRGDPDDFRITEKDIEDFIGDINASCGGFGLRREDITFAFGGLRPITETNLEKGSTAARKYEITDHRRDLKIAGLISVVGVKYTTCRFLAERVVDLVFDQLGRRSPAVATSRTRLVGGEIDDWEKFVAQVTAAAPQGVGAESARHVAHMYGSQFGRIFELAGGDAEAARLVPGSREVLMAEILHAVREETAVHLDDVVMRRTDLGSQGYPGREALETCADLMARELGWDVARREAEIERTERIFLFPES